MKYHKYLSMLLMFISIVWVFYALVMPIITRDKVHAFFGISMSNIFLWSGIILGFTSRKIEELQTQVEELTRKVNESESES